MSKTMRFNLALALVAIVGFSANVSAQQTNIGTPSVTAGHGYHSFIGSRWGVQGRGWFFNFGGGALPGGAAPPFGGFDGGGLRGGFGFGGGGVSGNFNFLASQGSSRSSGSTSPSVTSLNGYPGFIINGTRTPFVTRITPVVSGGFESPLETRLRTLGPAALRVPLRQAQRKSSDVSAEVTATHGEAALSSTNSSAERGELSVAEIRRQQAAADEAVSAERASRQAAAAIHVTEAQELAAKGHLRAAANAYSRAAGKLQGADRESLLNQARALRARLARE